ncbi:MAG: hypothetical protein ACRC10_02345 [Thermoguttaceae bacterium]
MSFLQEKPYSTESLEDNGLVHPNSTQVKPGLGINRFGLSILPIFSQ